MPNEELLMRDISDTALWAAVFRARETERPDALFHDPLAERLAGPRGAQIADTVPHASDNAWAWVMRTYLYDRLINEQLAQGVDMVINLAAGLDGRPYRMRLPDSLCWIEADLPQLISYKEEILAGEWPACRLERVAIDLMDFEKRGQFLARFSQQAAKVLVITEGLLVYLSDGDVGQLAGDLAAANIDSWLIDIGSPALVAMLQQTTGQTTNKAGAPLRFAPAAGPDFFLPYGWKAADVQSVFRAAVETKRLPAELKAFENVPELPRAWEGGFWSGVCRLERSIECVC